MPPDFPTEENDKNAQFDEGAFNQSDQNAAINRANTANTASGARPQNQVSNRPSKIGDGGESALRAAAAGNNRPQTAREALRQASRSNASALPQNNAGVRSLPSKLGSDLNAAERNALKSGGGAKDKASVGNQERGMQLPSSSDFYKRSAENRKKGGKRGIFIGLGAGGGLLSVVAGFGFLLPFKLPGIMDTIIDDAGKRVEKVVEARAERFIMQYILRGSTAAIENGNVISTGNPIGDLFANLRTSNFEKNLFADKGLSFKPGPNKTVSLISDGRDLGDVKNSDDIIRILNKGGSLTRRDLKDIVRSQIPAWRFFKRAKFVNWLRLKYHVPRFGSRKQKDGESDNDYNKAVRTDEITEVSDAEAENMLDFVNDVDNGNSDLNGVDNGGGAKQLQSDTQAAVDAATADGVDEAVTDKITKTLTQRIIEKIVGKSVGSLIPFVPLIDLGARLDHWMATKGLDSTYLQKLHAKYMKNSYITIFATFAGYADQVKAGDLSASATGMLANQFNGLEGAQSFNLIDSGKPTGQGLDTIQKINDSPTTVPEWKQLPQQIYGTIGLVPRAPLVIWYYTVSQLFDLIGHAGGDLATWVTSHIGPLQSLLKSFTGLIEKLFEGIMKLIGMDVDPLDQGAKLHLDVHAGAVASFNQQCEDMGCRQLTHSQALAMDNEIKTDQNDDISHESFADRIFNLNNTDSLAANLLDNTTLPNASDPVGTLALSSMSMLQNTPSRIANILTPKAFADQTVTSEDLYGLDAYGGTDDDLSAEVSQQMYDAADQCPTTADGSTFNTCLVDKNVLESMKCSVVQCADISDTGTGADTFDTYADTAGSSPAPDDIQNVIQLPRINIAQGAQPITVIASFLPMAALELSRRKL